MGICKSKQQKTEATTKSFHNNSQFENIQFFFSTESLAKVASNCLILFVDDSCKVTNNQLLQKAGTDIAPQIQQYFQAALQRQDKQLNDGDFFTFPGIDELQYKYISIICLPMWQNKKVVIEKFSKVLEACLENLTLLNVETFTITEMNFQLGYPPNITAKIFMQALYNKKNRVKEVYVIFSDQNHRNIYMHALKSFKKQVSQSEIDENASFSQSIYF